MGDSPAWRAVCAGIRWDERFEALVAQIAAEFIRSSMPSESAAGSRRETSIAGSVFLVRKSDREAKLRLFAGSVLRCVC